jgi:DnaJ-class molecular chaperone
MVPGYDGFINQIAEQRVLLITLKDAILATNSYLVCRNKMEQDCQCEVCECRHLNETLFENILCKNCGGDGFVMTRELDEKGSPLDDTCCVCNGSGLKISDTRMASSEIQKMLLQQTSYIQGFKGTPDKLP